jgi:hypothetical protein
VTAKKHLPLSITLEELLKGQQEAQQTRRLTSFWDYFLREEKTNSETNKQHLRNIEIRQRLKKAGFYTVLFIGISFAVEDFKLFNDNDVQEICTLAEEYIETYSLKDHFLQAGFYRVTQKLVRKVPDWEFGMFSTLSIQGLEPYREKTQSSSSLMLSRSMWEPLKIKTWQTTTIQRESAVGMMERSTQQPSLCRREQE